MFIKGKLIKFPKLKRAKNKRWLNGFLWAEQTTKNGTSTNGTIYIETLLGHARTSSFNRGILDYLKASKNK